MSEEQKVKVSNIIWSIVGAVATLGYLAILVLGIGDMEIPVETMELLPPAVQSGVVGLQTLSGRLIVGGVPLVGGVGVATKVLYSKTKIGKLSQANQVQNVLNKAQQHRIEELENRNQYLEKRLDKVETLTSQALQTIPNARTREVAKQFDEKIVVAKEVAQEIAPVVEKVVKVVKKARK